MFFFKVLSFLHLKILYLISDLIYIIAYYVLGYRKKVVRENLAHAFPEKTKAQRKAIEKGFFRNLTDSFAETIKLLTISERELRRRFHIQNIELVADKINNGEIVIGMQAHFFNWEGHVAAASSHLGKSCETVYLKINTPLFEKLMRTIRSRFGSTLVERNSFSKNYIAQRNHPRLIGLAADQRPQFSEVRYWTSFMNRDAAFFEGGEKLAKKFSHTVVYGEIAKPKRGYYNYSYRILASPPYDQDEPHSITERYVRAVEDSIRLNPALYLWSHNRWKEKK